MENNVTIGNKEKTVLVSIQWQTDIDKELKDKVHSLVLSALELWGIEKEVRTVEKRNGW